MMDRDGDDLYAESFDPDMPCQDIYFDGREPTLDEEFARRMDAADQAVRAEYGGTSNR
jgi:hypothetical protein